MLLSESLFSKYVNLYLGDVQDVPFPNHGSLFECHKEQSNIYGLPGSSGIRSKHRR